MLYIKSPVSDASSAYDVARFFSAGRRRSVVVSSHVDFSGSRFFFIHCFLYPPTDRDIPGSHGTGNCQDMARYLQDHGRGEPKKHWGGPLQLPSSPVVSGAGSGDAQSHTSLPSSLLPSPITSPQMKWRVCNWGLEEKRRWSI